MNVMKMPVREVLRNKTARTAACGWVLFGCGVVLAAGALLEGLLTGMPLPGAAQAGVAPLLLGVWMLDRSQLMAKIDSLSERVAKSDPSP